MCEDCPIYGGYPVSTLGWDDEVYEPICDDCAQRLSECLCDVDDEELED
jgi:hypothetical protein